jgi:hypothetical protein
MRALPKYDLSAPLFEKFGFFSMAGRGGARARAGRKAGGRNRATIERAALAERIVAEAEGKPGRKLGREMLEEFATMFGGLAAAFQPVGTGPNQTLTAADFEAWAKSFKEPLFEKYAKLAAKCADSLADFQSPRMSRVQVAAPPPSPKGPVIKRFTLSIFDHNGRPAPRSIDVRKAKSAN